MGRYYISTDYHQVLVSSLMTNTQCSSCHLLTLANNENHCRYDNTGADRTGKNTEVNNSNTQVNSHIIHELYPNRLQHRHLIPYQSQNELKHKYDHFKNYAQILQQQPLLSPLSQPKEQQKHHQQYSHSHDAGKNSVILANGNYLVNKMEIIPKSSDFVLNQQEPLDLRPKLEKMLSSEIKNFSDIKRDSFYQPNYSYQYESEKPIERQIPSLSFKKCLWIKNNVSTSNNNLYCKNCISNRYEKKCSDDVSNNNAPKIEISADVFTHTPIKYLNQWMKNKQLKKEEVLQMKKERRKRKNRIYAANCRLKRDLYIIELQKENKTLRKKIVDVETLLYKVKQHNEQLCRLIQERNFYQSKCEQSVQQEL